VKIPWGMVFLIAGIVLLNNTTWFTGASQVGTVLLVFGIISLVFWLFLILIVIVAFTFGDPKYVSKPKKRRGKIPPRW
jgi:uncharacterized membrane protein